MSCCPNQVVLPLVESCDGIRELGSNESLFFWYKVLSTAIGVTLKDQPQIVFVSDAANITLPKPSRAGVPITIRNTDPSLDSDVIAPAGTTVEGSTDTTLAPGESGTFIFDGNTGWWLV